MTEKAVEFCHSAEKGYMTLGGSEVEVGTLLLGNDRNNVIAYKVFSYF